MAHIEIVPQTEVTICTGVPWDNTYKHSVRFTSAAEQLAYFASKRLRTYTEYSYVRRSQAIKVDSPIGSVINANYLYFNNGQLDNRTYYCFIIDMEYLNNNTTVIYYQLDVLQTYLFDHSVNPGFIERETVSVASDTIGGHLVPENLDFGQYLYDYLANTGDVMGAVIGNDYNICVASTFDYKWEQYTGGYYNGLYSGLYYHFESEQSLPDFLKAVTDKNLLDGIISIFAVPTKAGTEQGGRDKEEMEVYGQGLTPNISSIDGYTPKNKKLFSYPYNVLYATNNEGNAQNYMLEYFINPSTPNFDVSYSMCCNPVVMCYPKQYKGVDKNTNEMLTTTPYPPFAWTSDMFQAYLAQNTGKLVAGAVNLAIDTVQGAVGSAKNTAAFLISGGAVGGISNPLTSLVDAGQEVISKMGEMYDISTLPPQAHGNQGGDILLALGYKQIDFYQAHITAEYAKRLDDFFSMFGYKVNRVGRPLYTRPCWDYIKTVACTITASIPDIYVQDLCAIYNSGVTWWKKPEYVGNYSLDNIGGA